MWVSTLSGMAIVACGPGDGSTLDERGRHLDHPYAPGVGSQLGSRLSSAEYEDIALSFLEPLCADCHSGATPAKALDLTFDLAWGEMVGVGSIQRPDLDLVEPGHPDDSYLVIKLEGSSRMVGRRMPRDLPPRPSAEIELVREWIQAGAARK